MPIVNPPTQYAGSTSAAILLSDGSTRIYYQAADGAIHEASGNGPAVRDTNYHDRAIVGPSLVRINSPIASSFWKDGQIDVVRAKNHFLFVRYSKRNNFSFSSASILLTKTTSYASLMVHQTPENSSAKVYYQVSNTRPQSIQDCCTLSLQISVTTGSDFKPLRLLTALPKHAGVPPTLTGPELASTEYTLPNSVLRCIAVLYRMLFLCFGLFK